MIPKIIHYCWFGGNPLPKLAKKCMKSWKKYCPDYRIIEWNESNFDISSAPEYVKSAFAEKKWAFVTDYVRLYAVYNCGGVYLDTDVEIIKSIDELLINDGFFGFEEKYVNTGLGFGGIKGLGILKEVMDSYAEIEFIKEKPVPCPVLNTPVFEKQGLVANGETQTLPCENVKIFSQEYFCPKTYKTGEIHITENTFSIHHFSASWHTNEEKNKWKKMRRKAKLKKKARAVLGEKAYGKMGNAKTMCKRIIIKFIK